VHKTHVSDKSARKEAGTAMWFVILMAVAIFVVTIIVGISDEFHGDDLGNGPDRRSNSKNGKSRSRRDR